MITAQDVYVAYRRAKSNQTGKGFRMPKDWDTWYETKLSPKNREYLETLTGYFYTTFSNIDIDKYMECGCELYKTFSYHMFLHKNIIDLYKEKDKLQKRRIKIDKDRIEKSVDFIKEYMGRKRRNGYGLIESYCKTKEGETRVIVPHYLKNDIDPLLFVYCIYYKYIKLTDIEREFCYNVVNRYRDLLQQMYEVEDFIKECESGLGD